MKFYIIFSHAHTGRSANRGDCSQACRLPYTLEDAQGRVVAFEKHLLSVKDNNQSDNLRALIAAGVRSFKIEGRYKEAPYVKNITGHYRRLLDAILEGRSDLARASSGRTRLFFTPDPDKTFHRGATDYFARGRKEDIGAFDTPTFAGTVLGTVSKIGPDWFEIETDETLANGDGLNYLHKRETHGIRANIVQRVDPAMGAAKSRGERLEGKAHGTQRPRHTVLVDDGASTAQRSNQDAQQAIRGGLCRVWPNEKMHELNGLRVGLEINRNSDHAWEQALTKKSAERKIPLRARFAETAAGFALTLSDEDAISVTIESAFDKQPAQHPEQAEAAVREQLARLGNTDFELDALGVQWNQPWFVPSSLINKLRRDAVEKLEAARLAAYTRIPRKAETNPPPLYPEESLSYLANVYNRAAQSFYTRHGVKLIAAAYEAHAEAGEVSLMITRHCIRYSLSLCPKQAKGVTGVQGQVRAEPMTLINGSERLRLEFDCRKCEMHVMGKMKKHILKSPPPSVVPLTFHKTRPQTH